MEKTQLERQEEKYKYSFKLQRIRGDRESDGTDNQKEGEKVGEERLIERRGNKTKAAQRSATHGRGREKINKPKKNRKRHSKILMISQLLQL